MSSGPETVTCTWTCRSPSSIEKLPTMQPISIGSSKRRGTYSFFAGSKNAMPSVTCWQPGGREGAAERTSECLDMTRLPSIVAYNVGLARAGDLEQRGEDLLAGLERDDDHVAFEKRLHA